MTLMTAPQRPHRSILLATCADEAILRARARSNPDVLLLELEDQVPKTAKSEARRRAVDALCNWGFPMERWVRTNPIESTDGMLDLLALPEGRPDALMPTKIRTAAEVTCADYILRRREEELGLAIGSIRLCPMIETGLSVLNLREIISASARISGVLLGSEDLSVDIGFTRSESDQELEWIRRSMVLTAHSLGVECFDVASLKTNDPHGLAEEARRAYLMGFDGKGCIDGGQVASVHQGFTPEEAQIEWARTLLREKRLADQRGDTILVVNGRTVEQPVLLQAARLLRRAGLDA